jgi:hypothetical protein
MADNKIINFLIEWAENYYKSRDAFNKSILFIEKTQNSLNITFKDKKEQVFVVAELADIQDILPNLTDNCSIITLNNRKNIDNLYEYWNKLSSKSIKIYFINPFSTTDRKWIINPLVHSKVSEPAALKTGLLAMFETVEPLTLEMLKTKL